MLWIRLYRGVCIENVLSTSRLVIVSTDSHVAGYRIASHLGIVSGNTVRAKHVGRDFGAFLRNIVGGEIRAYSSLLTEARREATTRMVEEAQRLGANGVILVRFSASDVALGAVELYVYGTAVRMESSAGGD